MRIFTCVAINAAAFGLLELRGHVACFARHRNMQANQWKVREIVIKGDMILPARFLMAQCAILTFPPFVDIISLVPAKTADFQGHVVYRPLVTRLTNLLLMSPQ